MLYAWLTRKVTVKLSWIWRLLINEGFEIDTYGIERNKTQLGKSWPVPQTQSSLANPAEILGIKMALQSSPEFMIRSPWSGLCTSHSLSCRRWVSPGSSATLSQVEAISEDLWKQKFFCHQYFQQLWPQVLYWRKICVMNCKIHHAHY